MERGNSSEETEEETGEGVGLEPAFHGSAEGEAGVTDGVQASAGAKGEDGPSTSAAPGSDEWISDETIHDVGVAMQDVGQAGLAALGGPAGIAAGEAAEWVGDQIRGSDDD